METLSILRQLNISLITDIPNPIIDSFNDIWSKLSIMETDVYHKNGGEFIYFIDDEPKQWIFFQDNKNERFWCNYDHYWSLFEAEFVLKHVVIQALTKLLVENALNNGVTTPACSFNLRLNSVENALNNGVTTPLLGYRCTKNRVENALNNGVTTPGTSQTQSFSTVENALNNGVTTPKSYQSFFASLVENALNNGVTTPIATIGSSNDSVENALNNGVTTPICTIGPCSIKVENALNNGVTTPMKQESIPSQK